MMSGHDLFGSFPGEIWKSALPAPPPPLYGGQGETGKQWKKAGHSRLVGGTLNEEENLEAYLGEWSFSTHIYKALKDYLETLMGPGQVHRSN